MRREPTDAERKLWSALRDKRLNGWKFRRQEQLGDYIVDFVCFGARLIIEADGSQHVESQADDHRTNWLQSQGFRLIRFWNSDILTNLDGVLTAILAALETPHPNRCGFSTPAAPLARGEGLKNSSPLAGEDGAACPRGGLAEPGEGT